MGVKLVCLAALAVACGLMGNGYSRYASIKAACDHVVSLNPLIGQLHVRDRSKYMQRRSGVFINSPIGSAHWNGLFPSEYIYAINIIDPNQIGSSPIRLGGFFDSLGDNVANCEHLNVSLTDVADEDLRYFGSSALRSLRLDGCSIGDSGLLHCLKDASRLTVIDVSETTVGDSGLFPLRNSRAIQSLQLYGTQVGDESISLLCSLPGLSELILSDSEVTALGVTKIRGMPKLSHLAVANLGISDSVIPVLSKLPSLAVLNVSSNPISANALLGLKECRSLRVLNVTGTQVDSESALVLMNAMPGVRVVFSTPEAASRQKSK